MWGTPPEEKTGTEQHRGLFTPEEAAEFLRVPPRMMRRLVQERRIGFIKVGRYVRFRREQLDDYMRQHEHPAARQRGR